MSPSPVLDLKPFVPAKDFAVSKQFYSDIGCTINFASNEIAEIQIGGFRFMLQPLYVQQHAENFMVQLMVEDADSWWQYFQRIELAKSTPSSC